MDDKTLKKTKLYAVLNLVFYFLTLGINYLGSSGFFNGMSQKDLSDKYMTLISPAPFAFSIWGVIYTLLLVTLVYFFIKRKDQHVGKLIRMTSPLFIASALFNMAWIVTFSYELLGISTILIFGLLFSLVFIVKRITINRSQFPSTLAGISFTLYASWVFIATILNISLFLVQQEWGGFGISDSIWTIVILFVAIGFVFFYAALYKNAAFPLPIAWAFFGIYSAYNSGVLTPSMSATIQAVLIGGIVILLAVSMWTLFKNGKALFPKPTS